MNFQELMRKMVELEQPVQEEKKADKDYDGDGEIESGKDEYMGSRMKAAEKSKDDKVDEEVVDECGMMGGMGSPMESPKQADSVTMNVSMNGSGAGGIRDLLNVLRDIQDDPDDNMPGDDMDMGPEPDDDMDPGVDMLMKKKSDDMSSMMDDDFANEPDEMYGDMDSVTGTGDDLHSKGIEAPKVNGGGNPMRVKSGETFKLPAGDLKIRLEGLYNDIKLREGSGPKEKAHSKYVDRNSAESKAKVQAAKDKMAADKKAEPGKKLLSKMKAK